MNDDVQEESAQKIVGTVLSFLPRNRFAAVSHIDYFLSFSRRSCTSKKRETFNTFADDPDLGTRATVGYWAKHVGAIFGVRAWIPSLSTALFPRAEQ